MAAAAVLLANLSTGLAGLMALSQVFAQVQAQAQAQAAAAQAAVVAATAAPHAGTGLGLALLDSDLTAKRLVAGLSPTMQEWGLALLILRWLWSCSEAILRRLQTLHNRAAGVLQQLLRPRWSLYVYWSLCS